MPVVPKFQKCKTCGERVPTKFEIKGDEVEYLGIHFCPNGHGLQTDLEAKPGEPTIDTSAEASSIWAGTVLLVVAAYVWLVRKEQD